MPLYEYECDGCGQIFEELIRRPSDEAELACSRCGGARVHRILSRPAAYSGGGGGGDCGPSGFG